MFIPKPDELKIDSNDSEKMQWNNWAWNSHRWVEIQKGYFQCSFCKANWTSTTPIGDNVRLCLRNPILNRLQIVDKGNETE